MLFPVKCFTCGKVIGNMYEWYTKKIEERSGTKNSDDVEYLEENNIKKTVQGELLDEMQLFDPCCRRHFITHVNMFQYSI